MKEQLYCKICGKPLTGNKTNYCSNTCKQKAHYQKIKANPNSMFSQTKRAWERKLQLVKLMGGKCEKCGYNFNIAALEFHHIDSSTKTIPLDARHLANTCWDTILEESKKCQLLCCRCHRELHYPESELSKLTADLSKYEYTPLESKKCPICGNKVKPGRTYCSKECRQKAQEENSKAKNYPTKETLVAKYQELNSWQKVADFYGLTRSIIKRIRKK